MKTLAQYRKLILTIKNQPHQLAEINLEVSGDYAYYSELYAEFEIKRAEFMDNMKDEHDLSDKACENKWILTEDGKKWIYTKKYLKGLEQLRIAIKCLLEVNKMESFNQY